MRGHGRRGAGRNSYSHRASSMLPRDANRRQESSNGVRDPTAAAGEDGRETAAEEEAAKALHERFGFEILKGARERLGWLINYHSSVRVDKETGANIGCICCYFACQDGSMFQVSVDCPAYMYVVAEEALTVEVDGWLRRKFAADLVDVVHVEREDPNLPNHLSGLKRKLLQLAFRSQEALQRVRRELAPIVARNKQGSRATSAYEGRVGGSYSRGTAGDGGLEAPPRAQEAQRGLLDLREHDVAHHMRFAIDSDVRCGHWYEVSVQEESALLRRRADLVQRAEARVCAFDIETTKLPLQFPNAEYDQVFMISYMVDRQGYLIINREVVSEDVADFEYTPKPEFEGPFRIFNCADERACLERWFEHMREVKPAVYVTYNGDYFDWPFIETRAAQWGLDMGREIGFRCAKGGGETRSRSAVHMDCMHWVNRDSYLPQGSRGLKAVTKYKLGYDPVEVDPEDMVRFAAEKPQAMASYSVSDAVATYYLYMTYVHPFIFSLSTIIPMPPDEVLRKGSGTLCEALLMVQAAQAGVVAPNKHQAAAEKSHEGHLLDSETYIGGKVEALESGVFRSDLPCAFRLDAAAYARLARSLDADLAHALRAEGRMEPEEAENYAEVRADILARLAALEAEPVREEAPLIYHLDVAAMYPNIILTNRLQPNAIVSAQDCAACDFNRPGKTCLREMDWVWRGEAFPAGRSDYARLKAQLQSELFPAAEGGAGEKRTWFDLPFEDRQRLLRDRLKKFCHKTYKRVLNKPVTERRRAGVCQRENSFYYDTVEAFRDRRYEYKGLSKEWKGRLDAARLAGDPIEVQRAKDMCVLYDSLQLAHKCILNSFYGYVMRKGARWYSMEMAGVVTHAGASIIELANGLVSAIGRPLELDTDGIWCALPGSFPEDFVFRARGGGKDFKMSYPCAVLNALVASSCANDQFAVLEDAGGRRYRTESRMSIEFEVDGPYRAMVLPASKEEGKLIKKRYAVFNHDGSLAELKGFELKRRGELKLIKVFQAEVFDRFLLGGTLEECYAAVAAVADQWLDLLDTEGVDVTDAELVDLISETCVMSKTLEEYEGRKSCAVTCATRLSHFLGDSRIKDKGLVCHYLVARSPADAPTSERAIPVAIFSTEPAVARTFLARWCGDAPGGDWERPPDVRAIVDWAYYRERLGSAIQKIVTIPAAMQRLPNPVPRVAHPAWLLRRVREKDDRRKQTRLTGLFRAAEAKGVADLEDWGSRGAENRAPNPTGGAAARGVDEVGATGERVGEADRGIGPAPPPTPASDPPPDRREDYAGWLESRKRAWRAARAERKRKAASLPLRGPPKAPRGASLGSLLAGAAAAADAGHWQLLTVESLAAPLARRLAASSLARLPPSAPRQPTHRVWAVAGGRLRALLLRVPRRALLALPVHASHPGLARWGRPVRRTLPHGMAAATALQVELPPGAAPAAALQRDMLRLRALGVFEDRLPGSRVAALALGCVARVDAAAREGLGAAEKEVYDLDHLTMKSVAECEYFPRAPQHVLVHSWTHPSRQLGLVLVHSRGAGHVWVAVPGSRAPREVSAALLDRLWAAAQQEGKGEEGSAESGEGGPEAAPAPVTGSPPPTWTVRFAASLEAARRGADGALRALLAQQAAEPGVLLVQASSAEESSPVAALVSPAALADWPCLRLPARPAGEEPGLLGWQPAAARRAARAAAQAGRWLGARVAAAQFAHLPLSALGADWALDAADAFFARALKKEGHALWEGEGAGERGGGGEEGGLSSCEVLCRSFEAGEGGGPAPPNPQPLYARPPDVAERLLHQEAAPELTLARPSVRRTACVALQLSHLAVAALLETAALGDCEGAALGDCASGCGPALAALRALAQGWMDSAVERGNLSADALLCALRRWLADRSRPGHDPALARVVRGLMHKTLLQLAAELERLGCPAVGASGSEVLVDTQKATIPSGLGAVAYVMQALQKKEMFRWLTLAPVRAYHAVVYLDRYNYAGILADVPARVLDVLGEDPKAIFETPILEEHRARFQADAQQARRDPRWDAVLTLKDHLPVAVQPKFFSALTEFVWLPWKAGQEAMAGDEVQGSQMVSRQAQAAFEAQRAWLRRELGGSYAERVLSHVRSTMLHVGARDGHASHAFPKLPGSCLSAAELGSPQLALVRGLCHLLGLDEQAREGVLLLRRQLLRLVRCKEFGPDAAFRDPCARVVLRDLSCAACQHCWDADLARDPLLLARAWRCPRPGCGAGLDAREAARQLAEGVRAAVDGFQLQDLPCAKCGTVAAQHLGAHCDVCSGKLRGGVRREDALGRLRAAEKVARHQGWTHVAEAAAWGVLHA